MAYVPRPVEKYLFMASGGQCGFAGCDSTVSELLADGRVLVTGKIAHLVAAKENGPRGVSELTKEERSKAPNLMVLCDRHHKLVDDFPEKYPVAILRRMKQEHEARVSAVTQHSVVPAITSPQVHLFGRDVELEFSCAWLAQQAQETKSVDAGVLVVHGAPGIGKTALAEALAARTVDLFDAGQVYLDFGSCGGDGADGVVSELLAAVGVAASSSQSPMQRRAALRTTTAGRRLLVIIDNANSEEVIRDLSGISDGLVVVCTSRSRMSGLADTGARYVELTPLDEQSAANLASSITGSKRLTSDQAVALSRACAGHPLGIRIAASRLATRSNLDFDNYLKRIETPSRIGNALSIGERRLQSIIEDAMCNLSPDQTRALQVMATLPNASVPVSVIAVAAVDDLDDIHADSAEDMSSILDDLFERNLVEQVGRECHRMHALIHRFVQAKADVDDIVDADRVIKHACMAFAAYAESVVNSIGFLDEQGQVPAPSNNAAIADFDLTRPACVALIETAHARTLWNPLVHLGSSLTGMLVLRGLWQDLARVYERVEDAGSATSNNDWLACAAYNRAIALSHQGRTEEAFASYAQCRTIAIEQQDLTLVASASTGFGKLLLDRGYITKAIPVLKEALFAWRATEERSEIAQVLHALALAYEKNGDRKRAQQYARNADQIAMSVPPMHRTGMAVTPALSDIEDPTETHNQCLQDVEIARSIGSPQKQAHALNSLGRVRQHPDVEGDPAEAFTQALQIFRDLGEKKGELASLWMLAEETSRNGTRPQAAELFEKCFELALELDDDGHAALALGARAGMLSDMGRHDDAVAAFTTAEDIATNTGDKLTLGSIQRRHGLKLMLTGDIEAALDLMRKAHRNLGDQESSESAAMSKVALGIALMNKGHWQAAAQTLREIVDAPTGTVDQAARGSAFRELAIVYSRRGLFKEATQALDQAEVIARATKDTEPRMHCEAARANILARQGHHAEAVEAYNRALKTANERQDIPVILHMAVNRLSCRSKTTSIDEIEVEAAELLETVRKLGYSDLESGLLINVAGFQIAHQSFDSAIANLEHAIELTSTCDNPHRKASALKNLGLVLKAQGDNQAALSRIIEARTQWEALSQWNEAASAFLIEAGLRLELDRNTSTPQTLESLVDPAHPLARQTLITLNANNKQQYDPAPAVKPLKDHGRTIHISPDITERLAAYDISDTLQWLATVEHVCYACSLPIAVDGEAELLLIDPAGAPGCKVRLTHPACWPSSTLDIDAEERPVTHIRLETECAIFGEDTATIVINCVGGWGLTENGTVDRALEWFLQRGFITVPDLAGNNEQSPPSESIPSRTLNAVMTNSHLTITQDDTELITNLPLSYLPAWYKAARSGNLLVMLGRNLTRMTWEDVNPLVKSSANGTLIAAIAHLTITPPTRNATCPCTPEHGPRYKYKHCCGRPLPTVAAPGP